MTPVAGQANTYDMARADEPTQAGTPLNKDTLLKDTTAGLYGLGSDAVPDDVLNHIASAPVGWALIASYTTAGAYEFTVPNGVTKIGVYIRAAGGGGGFQKTSANNNFGATGGAAGYCKNLIMKVTPLETIALVVGKGGKGASSNGSGKSGGSTSFNGETVDGGEGGKNAAGSSTVSGAVGSQSTLAFPLTNPNYNIEFALYGQRNSKSDQNVVESANKFDPFMSVPYAGGRAYYNGNVSSNGVYYECPPLLDGTKGGSGLYTTNANGEDAIGNGNGGGALVSSGYYKAGDGADGGVWIYAQGVRW